MNIVLAILIFSLIILVHEFGHFLFAKISGIAVLEFSLGLGPKVVGFQKGETFYCIKAFPFGGECRMLGEDEENNNEAAFGKKSVWARISVVAAGPIFNFLLAFLIALFLVGLGGFDTSVVNDVITVEGRSPMTEAGIEKGDRILKLNGERVYLGREVHLFLQLHNSKEDIEVVYRHDGEVKKTTVTPVYSKENQKYMIGISGLDNHKASSLLELIQYSIYEVRYWIVTTFKSLGMLITGQVGVKDLSGPVGIVNVIGDTYEQAKPAGFLVVLLSMMNMSILLTANLGVMNLLPLPALDGGRLVFLFIEAITRKKVPQNVEGMIHFIGIVLLMLLMVFIMYNDIIKIFNT